jgi:hypothetical protein
MQKYLMSHCDTRTQMHNSIDDDSNVKVGQPRVEHGCQERKRINQIERPDLLLRSQELLQNTSVHSSQMSFNLLCRFLAVFDKARNVVPIAERVFSCLAFSKLRTNP